MVLVVRDGRQSDHRGLHPVYRDRAVALDRGYQVPPRHRIKTQVPLGIVKHDVVAVHLEKLRGADELLAPRGSSDDLPLPVIVLQVPDGHAHDVGLTAQRLYLGDGAGTPEGLIIRVR